MKNSQLRISRQKLLHNFNYFKSKLSSSTQIMVLVKANGYGLGDVEVATLVKEFGANYLAVAYSCEGVKLRESGVQLPIIVLAPGDGNFEKIIEKGLEPSIISVKSLRAIIELLKSRGISGYPIHLKLDTGMQRVGTQIDELPSLQELLKEEQSVRVVSLFSHLAVADDPSQDIFTNGQIELFEKFSSKIMEVLPYKPLRHILNSAGIERFSHAQYDMVRLGIGLYGTSSIEQSLLLPPATLVAPVLLVKNVTEGTIGYGRHGKVTKEVTKVATVGLGYADGFDRRLSRGNYLCQVAETLVPTIGNVSMDTFVIDVSGLEVTEGDEVVIYGDNPNPAIMAKTLDTITYEIFASTSLRVERVIVE